MAALPPDTVSIPVSWVQDPDVSKDALAAAAWIAQFEPGTVVDMDELKNRFPGSRGTRQKTLAALRELGLLELRRGLSDSGQFCGSRWIVTVPGALESREPARQAPLKKKNSSSRVSSSAHHRQPAQQAPREHKPRGWVDNPLTEAHFTAADLVLANTSATHREGTAKIIRWGQDQRGMSPEQTARCLVSLHREGRPVTIAGLKEFLAATGHRPAPWAEPEPAAVVPPAAAVADPYEWDDAPLLAPDPVGDAVYDLLRSFRADRSAVLAVEVLALARGYVPEAKHVLEVRDALATIAEPTEDEVLAAARELAAAPGVVRGWNIAQSIRSARGVARTEAARARAQEAAVEPAAAGLPGWWRRFRESGDVSVVPAAG